MDLFWNLSTGQIMTGAQSQVALQNLTFKRRDGAEIRLGFVRAGSSELVPIPSTSEIRFALKEQGEWDADPVVFTAAFAVDGDGFWVGNPSLNTTELDALFGTDPEAASLTLMGEFTRRDDTGEPWNSTQTFAVTVNNDVIRGDEGTPTNAADPTDYLTAVQSEARYVRYDTAQSLTSGEQAQAQSNIGVRLLTHAGINVFARSDLNGGTTHETCFNLTAGTWNIMLNGVLFKSNVGVGAPDPVCTISLNAVTPANVSTGDAGMVATLAAGARTVVFGGASANITLGDTETDRVPIIGYGKLVLTGATDIRFTLTNSTTNQAGVWFTIAAHKQ